MLPGSMPTPPYSVGYGSLSPYSSSLPPHPFLYPPYDFLCYRSPHQSLPPLPSHGLPPLPPATMAKAKHASLPAAPAVVEALDDLEREVTRGFVEDLVHALAPPPSSLPLPTFSLVRAAAAAKAAPPSCAV